MADQKSAAPNAVPYTVDSQDAEKMSIEDVLAKVSGTKKGLTSSEAAKRLDQCGQNALVDEKQNPLLKLLKFFWGPIPWMIEIAAVLSLIAEDWKDLCIIMFMLIFNAMIGFWEEHKASNALEALKKGLALKARALRDGKWAEVDAAKVL